MTTPPGILSKNIYLHIFLFMKKKLPNSIKKYLGQSTLPKVLYISFENLFIFSPKCNEMMEELEKGSFTRFIWSILKPYIRGKILYTPDTPATRRLISIVNQTFAPIERFRTLTDEYVNNYSNRIRGILLNPDTQEMIRDLFSSNESTIWNTFLESPLRQSLPGKN